MNQELVATNSTLSDVISRIQREIQTLKETAHILTPMARTQIDSVAVGKIPVLRVASISPDPKDQEVYELKQLPGKFILTKHGLQRLEAIAGITGWTTEVIHIPMIDAKGRSIGDPLHVKATAYAEITDIDGTKRGKPQTFELNLNDGSPQAEKMVKTKDGKKDYRELHQARINIIQLAESKAMNRVRRDLLNLQSTFTQAELKKPFVIMCLIDAPLDVSDPLIKKLLIMKQLNISAEMYEAAASTVPTPTEVPVLPVINVVPELPPVDPKIEQEIHNKLVEEVGELYKKKVRGGRGSNKAPLPTLSTDELSQLKALLEARADMA
jgi:hypothetical protein